MAITAGPTLTIQKLAEPVTEIQRVRESDASANNNPTPASLDADLAHYKELFQKLRFSYISQVTRERFLRSILACPPHFASAEENVQLEAEVMEMKAALKAQKLSVAALVAEVEATGRDLARRYEQLEQSSQQARELPTAIQQLENTIRELQAGLQAEGNVRPLHATLKLVEERQQQIGEVDMQIIEARKKLATRRGDLNTLQAGLQPLLVEKVRAAQELAKEDKRGDEEREDEVEGTGKWLRGVQAAMQGILQA